MTQDKVYITTGRSAVCIELAKPRKVRQTLRKNQVAPTPIHLRPNSMVNLCEYLEMSRAQVWEVIADSPEVLRFQKLGLVEIIDPQNIATLTEVVAQAAIQSTVHDDAMSAAQESVATKDLARLTAPSSETRRDYRIDQQAEFDRRRAEEIELMHLDEPQLPAVAVSGTFEPQVIVDDDSLAASVAEQNAKSMDTSPSSKWPMDKLVAYANERGIKTDGMGKTIILRKLRDLEK